MHSRNTISLCSMLLLVGCFTTKLPTSITPFRLNTQANDEFRLGYIAEEPSIEYIGDKKPNSPWFENYDTYAKVNFTKRDS